MAKKISITNQKGGVGKTTTTVNLGTSLALLDRNVLLIDLDPQGSLAQSFGIKKSKIEGGVYNILAKNEDCAQHIIKSDISKLHIIPNNTGNYKEEHALYDNLDLTLLNKKISPLLEYYHYVLIDCPPTLGALTCSALVTADTMLVPLQTEFYAVNTLGSLFQAARHIKALYNNQLGLEGILLTMVDMRLSTSVEIIKRIKDNFNEKVFNTCIPRNSSFVKVPEIGKPVALFDVQSKGARAYLNLAREIINRNIGL